MSRYIDADRIPFYVRDVGDRVSQYDIREIAFASEIKNMPTADVVEVKHGYWTGVYGDQCSNCGKSLRDLMDGDSYYSSEFEYGGFDALVACPFCGAKMDGERKEK